MLSLISYRRSMWFKQIQHRYNITIQTTDSLHNTPKENICLPGTGRKLSCWCTDHAMATSQGLSGYCHNEHLVTALFQLQGQEFPLGCPEFMAALCEITKGFDWGSCLSFPHQLDPGRSLPLCVLTTHDCSEQAAASATTVNELFLGTSQEPLMLNWISFTWSKQHSPS